MGDGMSKLYDPQVEEAKETWQAKWEGWKKWVARTLGLNRLWEWVKGLTIAKNKPPESEPDIIFLPDADSPEVRASTIYRYSPPDEFVQFLAKESIFIPKDAGESSCSCWITTPVRKRFTMSNGGWGGPCMFVLANWMIWSKKKGHLLGWGKTRKSSTVPHLQEPEASNWTECGPCCGKPI
jgi:hypothetical protein